uniref:Uncharacterized protein n=1 Tax=Schizaphis graminum TaxID=13262 RepID=A0A2S2NN69_SCHGA
MDNYTLMLVFLLSFYFIGLGSADTQFDEMFTECCNDMENQNLMYFDIPSILWEDAVDLNNILSNLEVKLSKKELTEREGYAYIFVKNRKENNIKPKFITPTTYCRAIRDYRQPLINNGEPIKSDIYETILTECLGK